MSESATIQLLRLIFREHQRQSWRELNIELRRALSMAINLRFDIHVGDWDIIAKDFRYTYWASVSENGHHIGEGHYGLAAKEHRPAAIEYERFYGRSPFILDGKRLSCGDRFTLDDRCWTVTGWGKDNQRINLVSYDDHLKQTGRKLKTISADQWKQLRKKATR